MYNKNIEASNTQPILLRNLAILHLRTLLLLFTYNCSWY